MSSATPPLSPPDAITPTASPAMDSVTLVAIVLIVALTSFVCTILGKFCFDRWLRVSNQGYYHADGMSGHGAHGGHGGHCRSCRTPLYGYPPSSVSHPRSRSAQRHEDEAEDHDSSSNRASHFAALAFGKSAPPTSTFQRLGIRTSVGGPPGLALPLFAKQLENQHLSPIQHTPPMGRPSEASDPRPNRMADALQALLTTEDSSQLSFQVAPGMRHMDPDSLADTLASGVYEQPCFPKAFGPRADRSNQSVKYLSPNDVERPFVTPHNARSRQRSGYHFRPRSASDSSHHIGSTITAEALHDQSLPIHPPPPIPQSAPRRFARPVRGLPGNTGPVSPRPVAGFNTKFQGACSAPVDSHVPPWVSEAVLCQGPGPPPASRPVTRRGRPRSLSEPKLKFETVIDNLAQLNLENIRDRTGLSILPNESHVQFWNKFFTSDQEPSLVSHLMRRERPTKLHFFDGDVMFRTLRDGSEEDARTNEFDQVFLRPHH